MEKKRGSELTLPPPSLLKTVGKTSSKQFPRNAQQSKDKILSTCRVLNIVRQNPKHLPSVEHCQTPVQSTASSKRVKHLTRKVAEAERKVKRVRIQQLKRREEQNTGKIIFWCSSMSVCMYTWEKIKNSNLQKMKGGRENQKIKLTTVSGANSCMYSMSFICVCIFFCVCVLSMCVIKR